MADDDSLSGPLGSPVFQGVSGFSLMLTCALVSEQLAVPRELTLAVLAVGLALFASGVWHMLPRGVDDPVLDG